MGEIITFPTPVARDWKDLHTILKAHLVKVGLTETAQDYVLKRMEAFHGKLFIAEFDFAFPASTPPSVYTQLDEFEKKIQQLTSDLFFDRLLVEIELTTALRL